MCLSQFVSGHVLFAESSNHGRSVSDEFRTSDSSHPNLYGTESKTHKRWMQRMVDDLGTAVEEADDPSEIEKSADPQKEKAERHDRINNLQLSKKSIEFIIAICTSLKGPPGV